MISGNDRDEHISNFLSSVIKNTDVHTPASQDLFNSLLVDTKAAGHILTDEEKFTTFDKSFETLRRYIELANGRRMSTLVVEILKFSCNMRRLLLEIIYYKTMCTSQLSSRT